VHKPGKPRCLRGISRGSCAGSRPRPNRRPLVR
jgi:hypothetical protein